MTQTENAKSRSPDSGTEAVDVLIAISVIAKRLAEKLRKEAESKEENR